ncbi:hypothetical protein K525DRAFT_273108 [Schizophyllum commune Loenen D]|nr:hypothetical protein K525DRAFT_273108 [Schizophyllum commune Loenen D]
MAGFTPEQMQQVMAFILQQQAAGSAHAEGPGAGVASASSDEGRESVADESSSGNTEPLISPPTPVKTPPRKGRKQFPPATPKAKANTTPMKIIPPSPAANTPSSKMAQLTLDGRKLSSTPSLGDGDGVAPAKKKTVPTGLTYENLDASSKSGRAPSPPGLDDDNVSSISNEFPYNPLDNLPKKDTSTPERPRSTENASNSKSKRRRNDPTTIRWINTRTTTQLMLYPRFK